MALDLRSKGDSADAAFRWIAIGAGALVLVVLGLIAIVMTSRAAPVLGKMGVEFFGSEKWSAPEGIYGALPFIWGTLFTATIAIVISVPVSLGVALFITNVAPPWLKKPMVYMIDLLAVVPSVVFGLWGVLVLSHSKGGLVGAVMLGLGRAMGETIAAALVIGSAAQIKLNPFASGNSMPAVIANEWGEADELHKSALIALAVTLFLITIIVNLVATWIVQRSMQRSRGRTT